MKRRSTSSLSGRFGLRLPLLDSNIERLERPRSALLASYSKKVVAISIIMLTGNADLEVDVKTMEAGAADYLVKGQFSGEHLEAARTATQFGFAVERTSNTGRTPP